jgi:hypothetical protein
MIRAAILGFAKAARMTPTEEQTLDLNLMDKTGIFLTKTG